MESIQAFCVLSKLIGQKDKHCSMYMCSDFLYLLYVILKLKGIMWNYLKIDNSFSLLNYMC